MHIQVKFKSHLDFSWFVPKRRFVLPLVLSVSVYPGPFYSGAISLPISLSLLSFDRPFPPPLTSAVTRFLPPSLASLSLPRWLPFSGRDVPPLLHFSQPRRGIILDGTVDNVYGT